MIKADGGDPAQYAELARRGELNRTHAAARLLVRLDRIDLSLARIGREEADLLAAIHQALLTATCSPINRH